jgi:hypothetical protein
LFDDIKLHPAVLASSDWGLVVCYRSGLAIAFRLEPFSRDAMLNEISQTAIGTVTNNRTTVLVSSGTYDRVAFINQPLPTWILGEKGAVITALEIEEPNVYIEGTSIVTLESLTIKAAGGSSNGYGVRCVGTENSPTLTVRRGTITNNANGGVVADNCATVTLDSNTITANAGGGVSLNTSGFEVTAKSAQRGLLPISVLTKRGDVVLDSY